MKTAQWPQDLVGVRPMEELVANPKPKSTVERKVRPSANCPRCNSTNTKFCYYNNYSLSQPRFFCKTCRRYWTEGGTLRNIPVGGGTRKHNKKSSSSTSTTSSSTTSSKKLFQDSVPLLLPNPNHFMSGPPQDLNLGFSSTDFRTINELIQVPNFDLGNPNSSPSTSPPTTTTLSRGLMSSFMSMPNITSTDPNSTVYSSSTSSTAFPNFPVFIKPSLNFSLDGLGSSNYGSFQGVVEQETNGKLLFPFADLNQQVSSSNNAANEHADDDQNREQPDNGDHATGYWNAVIGTAGGSW